MIDAVAGRTFLAFYDSHEGQRMRASGTELRPFIGHHKMQFVNAAGIELALKQSRSEHSAVGILGTNEHESIELLIRPGRCCRRRLAASERARARRRGATSKERVGDGPLLVLWRRSRWW